MRNGLLSLTQGLWHCLANQRLVLPAASRRGCGVLELQLAPHRSAVALAAAAAPAGCKRVVAPALLRRRSVRSRGRQHFQRRRRLALLLQQALLAEAALLTDACARLLLQPGNLKKRKERVG